MNPKINETRNIALSQKAIRKILDNKIKVIIYNELENYTTIEEVVKPGNGCIILFVIKEDANSIVGHWCLITLVKNKLEFFDPMGNYEFNLKKLINSETPNYLSKLLYQSKYKLEFNDHKIQKIKDDISTCGRHCIVRYIYRGIPIDEYYKIITQVNPDDFVSYMTYFNFEN